MGAVKSYVMDVEEQSTEYYHQGLSLEEAIRLIGQEFNVTGMAIDVCADTYSKLSKGDYDA